MYAIDENNEWLNCMSMAKLDHTIGHVTDYLKATQTVVDQMVNEFNIIPIELDKPRAELARLNRDYEQQKNEIIYAGNVINTVILGIYLSLLPLYNNEELNIFAIISPKVLHDMVAALIKQKKLVKNQIIKYFDEIKWRLVAQNEQAGGLSTTRSLIKKMQEILKNAETKQKSTFDDCDKRNVKINIMLNLTFYINLYTEFYSMLIKLQKMIVINTSPKLREDWNKHLGHVEFLLDEFKKTKKHLFQNDAIAGSSKAGGAFTDHHKVEEISSDSESQPKGQNSNEFLTDHDDSMSFDSHDIEDLQDLQDSDEDHHNVEEASSGFKLFEANPPIRHSLNEMQSCSSDTKSPFKKCIKCNERAKIEAVVNQMKKDHKEMRRLITELRSTNNGLIASSLMTTTDQRTNDHERIQREIASVANAIGTVIYGFKLAILPFSVQYELMAIDMKSALDQVGVLSSYLKDMAEPVENKLTEYLKITKNRLLAYPDVDETLINAQTKNLEKFIGTYTFSKKSNNKKGAMKLHNLNFYIHLFSEMYKLLQSIQNNSLLNRSTNLREIWSPLISFTEEFIKLLKN